MTGPRPLLIAGAAVALLALLLVLTQSGPRLGEADLRRLRERDAEWVGALAGVREELRGLRDEVARERGAVTAAPIGREAADLSEGRMQAIFDRLDGLVERLDRLDRQLQQIGAHTAPRDLNAEIAAARPRDEAALAPLLEAAEEDLTAARFGWSYSRVLAEYGRPDEARLTGNQENVHWIYRVGEETVQFIFHEGLVARVNAWQD